MLEIIILVSSANNIDFDIEFILRRRSFVYIMNNKSHRIDPWGKSMFQCTPVREQFLVVLGDFTSTFCLLLVKPDLNQSSYTPQVP